jgi:dTDP-4-dehydrorhamnose 3,5-epimerase
MIFTETILKGSFVIDLNIFEDERGWFGRTFCKNEFEKIGHTKEWVQLNHSFTKEKGTIRGMHFQLPPFGEIKMVRCIAGIVYDVMVDLRKDSPTFLKSFVVELSASNKKMIYIPEGFAHGFQTITDNCELIYHHTEFYKPNVESGLKYDDPKLNFDWPLTVTNISERDKQHDFLKDNFIGI